MDKKAQNYASNLYVKSVKHSIDIFLYNIEKIGKLAEIDFHLKDFEAKSDAIKYLYYEPTDALLPEELLKYSKYLEKQKDDICVLGIDLIGKMSWLNPYQENQIKQAIMAEKDKDLVDFSASIYKNANELSNYEVEKLVKICSDIKCLGQNTLSFHNEKIDVYINTSDVFREKFNEGKEILRKNYIKLGMLEDRSFIDKLLNKVIRENFFEDSFIPLHNIEYGSVRKIPFYKDEIPDTSNKKIDFAKEKKIMVDDVEERELHTVIREIIETGKKAFTLSLFMPDTKNMSFALTQNENITQFKPQSHHISSYKTVIEDLDYTLLQTPSKIKSQAIEAIKAKEEKAVQYYQKAMDIAVYTKKLLKNHFGTDMHLSTFSRNLLEVKAVTKKSLEIMNELYKPENKIHKKAKMISFMDKQKIRD